MPPSMLPGIPAGRGADSFRAQAPRGPDLEQDGDRTEGARPRVRHHVIDHRASGVRQRDDLRNLAQRERGARALFAGAHIFSDFMRERDEEGQGVSGLVGVAGGAERP